jgi:translation initiation factor IF-3
VPVPRRFDRRPPDRDLTRINDRIRVPEVRLVGEDGKQIGVIKTADALAYAQERDLDLVEVAPDARPPVCRVLDYSKYKYEQAQKLKAARKHQQQITIREIKFRPKIALNDYETKKGHVRRFLLGKDRVKVTIMFRGREVTHPERGTALLSRLAEELADVGVVEQTPIQDGRNMTMMLAPSKSVLAAAEKAAEAAGSDRHHAAPAAEKDGAKPAAEVSSAANSAGDGHPEDPSADQNHAEAPEAVPAAAPTPEAVSAAASGGGDGQQNGVADTVSPTPSDAPA